jgi:hypothetical protein
MKKVIQGYEQFGAIDPATYKRKDKMLFNPIINYKLYKAAKKGNLPFDMMKQKYVEKKYNIPSDNTLALMKAREEAFRSASDAPKIESFNFSPLGLKYV